MDASHEEAEAPDSHWHKVHMIAKEGEIREYLLKDNGTLIVYDLHEETHKKLAKFIDLVSRSPLSSVNGSRFKQCMVDGTDPIMWLVRFKKCKYPQGHPAPSTDDYLPREDEDGHETFLSRRNDVQYNNFFFFLSMDDPDPVRRETWMPELPKKQQ